MNDEIDLRIFGIRIFRRWRIFCLYLAAAAGVFIAAMTLYAASTNKVMRYEVKLFGIDNAYPNGVPFSTTDFLEPDILAELFESVGMGDIDDDLYTQIVSIQPLRRDVGYVHARFDVRAAAVDRKDSGALAALQELAVARDAEIAQANTGRFILQVDYERHGIDKESAKVILDAWPRVWERHVVDNYRVVTDLSLRTMTHVAGTDLNVPENVYYANQQLNFITDNIGSFTHDPRFKRIVSSEGRTPKELLRSIDEYRSVFFRPLYSSVLAIKSPLSEFYLNEQKNRIVEIDKQIGSLQSIVDDITNMEVGVRTRANQEASDGGDIIQIGDGTLNDIVGLVQKASLQDFLTSTLERRHGLVVEKASVERQLAQVSNDTLLSPEFIEQVSGIHQSILNEYSNILDQAEALALDSRLDLFRPISNAYTIGGRIHPKWHLLIVVLALGMFIVAVSAAVVPLKHENVNLEDNGQAS